MDRTWLCALIINSFAVGWNGALFLDTLSAVNAFFVIANGGCVAFLWFAQSMALTTEERERS